MTGPPGSPGALLPVEDGIGALVPDDVRVGSTVGSVPPWLGDSSPRAVIGANAPSDPADPAPPLVEGDVEAAVPSEP